MMGHRLVRYQLKFALMGWRTPGASASTTD